MNQRLNTDANNFISQVEKYSKRALNRKAELIVIYDAAVNSNQVRVFRDLCFNAKYLVGIMRVLQEGGNNPQIKSLDYVKKDFSENMVKSIEQIRQIISESDETQKKYFEEEFLAKTHTGLTNLNELLADLEKVKIYLNYLKRENQN